MSEQETKYTVLAVDDEPSILSSLKRQLRKTPFELIIGNSGKEGLELLKQHEVQIVVSDMRMPEMSGAEFLTEVQKEYPDTVRMILTGYSDMDSTVDAINNGGVFSYISKPWNRDELLNQLTNAAKTHHQRKAKAAALNKVSAKHQALSKVTLKLQSKLKQTQEAVRHLKGQDTQETNYDMAIEVFANLIDLKIPGESGLNRDVSKLSELIARDLELSEEEIRNVRLAGILYNVGKIGIDNKILEQPYSQLSENDKLEFQKYPAIGEHALAALTPLGGAIEIIKNHRELIDGSGFPRRLAGKDLDLATRIVSTVVAFRELIAGRSHGMQFNEGQALNWLHRHEDKYDPSTVGAIAEILENNAIEEQVDVQEISMHALQPGMTLAQDIVTKSGILLLSDGQVLSNALLTKLISIEGQIENAVLIYFPQDEKPAASGSLFDNLKSTNELANEAPANDAAPPMQ